MKKFILIYIIFALCPAFADVDFAKALQSTSMPTDAEIRAVLKQFDFTGEQEDAVFKEVKGKLKELYYLRDTNKANIELNRYLNQIDNEAVSVFMDTNTKRQFMQDVARYYR